MNDAEIRKAIDGMFRIFELDLEYRRQGLYRHQYGGGWVGGLHIALRPYANGRAAVVIQHGSAPDAPTHRIRFETLPTREQVFEAIQPIVNDVRMAWLEKRLNRRKFLAGVWQGSSDFNRVMADYDAETVRKIDNWHAETPAYA